MSPGINSGGINSGRNGASTDKRIADRIVRMDMSRPPFSRVPHGYRFTRGVSKTGPAGAGTVLNFGIPQHTAYPYRGVTGIHGY